MGVRIGSMVGSDFGTEGVLSADMNDTIQANTTHIKTHTQIAEVQKSGTALFTAGSFAFGTSGALFTGFDFRAQLHGDGAGAGSAGDYQIFLSGANTGNHVLQRKFNNYDVVVADPDRVSETLVFDPNIDVTTQITGTCRSATYLPLGCSISPNIELKDDNVQMFIRIKGGAANISAYIGSIYSTVSYIKDFVTD